MFLRTILAAALAAAAVPAAAQQMEPGEWQFRSVLTPPMGEPRTTVLKRCVTNADAGDPSRFASAGQSSGCTVTPGERTAKHYVWKVSCPQQGMTGTGEATFGEGKFDSEMRVTVEAAGRTMHMNNHVTGKRLGACKAGE